MSTSRAGSRYPIPSRRPAGSRRAAGRPEAAGFTLLEILVTLAIVAVVTALAAPAISSRLLETPFDRSARLLKGMLEQAHAQAAVTGQTVSVVWAPEARRFTLREPRRERGFTIPAGVDVTARGLTRASVEVGVPDRRAGIAFYPLGGSTGGSIGLRAGANAAQLAVDPLTGYVEMTITR
jgi:type II secretion system protein H